MAARLDFTKRTIIVDRSAETFFKGDRRFVVDPFLGEGDVRQTVFDVSDTRIDVGGRNIGIEEFVQLIQ